MGWSAEIIISAFSGDEKHKIARNCVVAVTADSQQEALEATESIYEEILGNKQAFIRVKPEADSYTDFDTKAVHHRGYSRFSYFNEPGKREMSSRFGTVRALSQLDAMDPYDSSNPISKLGEQVKASNG